MRRKVLTLLATFFCVIAGYAQEAPKASSFGFNKEDATKCLQDAIASGCKKLIIDYTGSDWVLSQTLKLPSNFELEIENGVVLRARRGYFKGRSEALMEVRQQKNVIIRGKGKVVLIMNKNDYLDKSQYEPSHHRHTLNIFNSDQVIASNLTLLSSGGDGVYVGTNNCFNVTLEKIVTDDHLRDGLSVTGVYNFKASDCSFSGGPQAGCDVEQHYPGGHGRSLEKIVFENCSFANNQGLGLTIKNTGHGNNDPIDLVFRNCQFYNNQRWGVYCQGLINPEEPRGRIVFDNCQIFANQENQIGWRSFSKNVDVLFKNCHIDASGTTKNPIWLTDASPENLTGIQFIDCIVQDDVQRDPVSFMSRFGNGIVNSKFDLKQVMPDGSLEQFQEKEFLLASKPNETVRLFKVDALPPALLPESAELGEIAGSQLKFRDKFRFLAYAERGQELKIVFRNTPINLNNESKLRLTKVRVIGPTFDSGENFTVTPGESYEYIKTVDESGTYTFDVETATHVISLESSAAGQGFAANERLYLLNCAGKLFFSVPAGCQTVKIEADDHQFEASEVQLFDAKGKLRDSKSRKQRLRILTAEREDYSASEIWHLQVKASKLWLRIGSPILPIFSCSEKNLLRAK